jgi:hypothetical protein
MDARGIPVAEYATVIGDSTLGCNSEEELPSEESASTVVNEAGLDSSVAYGRRDVGASPFSTA